MPRGYSTTTLDALSQDKLLIAHLVELELDPYTIRLSDAYRELELDGETYYPAGHFLGFGDIEETATLMVNPLTVSLSGVDQTMIALLLQEAYIDRTVRIIRVYLDPVTAMVKSSETLFEGRVNKPGIGHDPDAGKCSVSLEVANIWVDFERSPGRTTNHDQQQLHFPGDRGFEFAGNVFKDLPWGKE